MLLEEQEKNAFKRLLVVINLLNVRLGITMQSGDQWKTPYRLLGIFSARPKSPTTAVKLLSSHLIRQFCECRKNIVIINTNYMCS